MKTLILLITAIVFSSNCYAVLLVNNDEPIGHYYFCQEKHLFECIDLKKGDVLSELSVNTALLYCDTELPIISHAAYLTPNETVRSCFYNGRTIKAMKHRTMIKK